MAPGLLVLGLGIYQLSLPGVLFGVQGYSNGIGYDDGVYVGAALRLMHGAIPYRDFVLLHPPGVPLLLVPFLALGSAIGGSHVAFALARIVTIVVTASNASLAAIAVRYRGIGAMLVAGFALACFPLAVTADHSVYLEPYLVFFSLIGVCLMFQDGSPAGPGRLALAGVAFGFATACKVWGIILIAAAIAACLPHWRRRVRPLALGVIAGVGVLCLPFFLADPGAFLHQIISDQLSRVTPGTSVPASFRLPFLTGVSGLTYFHGGTGLALALAIALIVFVAVGYALLARTSKIADWFLLAVTVASVFIMFSTASFADHYSYFPAAFIAMVVGICTARILEVLGRLLTPLTRFRGALVPLILALAASVFLIPQQASYAQTYLSNAEDPTLILQSFIPPGACVVADQVSWEIAVNRFTSAKPGCPNVIDPYGVWLSTFSQHLPPYQGPYPPEFPAEWGQWFSRADWVIQIAPVPEDDLFPWSTELQSWFTKDFRVAYAQTGMYLYQHVHHTPPPAEATGLTSTQLVTEGLAAERAGMTDKAFGYFKAAEQRDPSNAVAHFDLGVIYQNRGDKTDAAAEYRKALAIDPTFVDALYNMGVLLAPSDPSSAISFYRQAIAVQPTNATANFNLGVLLVRQGEVAEGDSYIETGVRLNPSLSADIPPGISIPGSTP